MRRVTLSHRIAAWALISGYSTDVNSQVRGFCPMCMTSLSIGSVAMNVADSSPPRSPPTAASPPSPARAECTPSPPSACVSSLQVSSSAFPSSGRPRIHRQPSIVVRYVHRQCLVRHIVEVGHSIRLHYRMRKPRRDVPPVGVMGRDHLHRLRRVPGARREIQIPPVPIDPSAGEANREGAAVRARLHPHVPRGCFVEAHGVRADAAILGERQPALVQHNRRQGQVGRNAQGVFTQTDWIMVSFVDGTARSSIRTHCAVSAGAAGECAGLESARTQCPPVCRRAGGKWRIPALVRAVAYPLHLDESLGEERSP